MTLAAVRPRFSGHETFACRFAWLPKAVRLIARDPKALSDDERAILELGLGKNMVRALRFWLEAFGVASAKAGVWSLLPFGEALFGEEGLDPYIERVETQWLLHWRLSTAVENPLFAWRHILYRRMRPDFTRSELLAEMRIEGERLGYEHSDVTLLQHADVFIHSYVGSLNPASPEDALDGPLVDLGLVRRFGRRRGGADRIEPVFTLARAPIAEIGGAVTDYAITSYWDARRAGESVVTFRDLAYGEGSPGATLRIEPEDLRDHLERSPRLWSYRPSGDAGSVTVVSELDQFRLLQEIYA
ncbi:DUF4007 family protein [Gluconacetobacter diazotrophicus]|uniref:DUF4007 family protein n=1 Tax=Gluconacetobacter diazotrophicus TaxID=33996 RepID=UPI0011995F7B|nr:DUF4007 family protein [Gluconacetobacter diazotrophicus]TWB02482.1 uncharacterized protein DUF4007 [Gluconacetobacter diazotrophicus]